MIHRELLASYHFMDFVNIAHFFEQWIHAHPQWLFLFIMLSAAAESLAIIGMIIPGVVLLFGAGTLVGKGYLSLKAALIASWVGAFIGDTSSFFVGQLFHAHIRDWYLFKKHKIWITKGENFFVKHGALSVFIGRFAGPLRAIIPIIAGMMGMPTTRFILTAFIAGALWSPLYLLPGYLVGASMHWTQFVSTEFIYTVIILAFCAWAISFLYAQYTFRRIRNTMGHGILPIILLSILFLILAVLDKSNFLHSLNQHLALSTLHGETLLSDKIAVATTMLGGPPARILWTLILLSSFWFGGNKKSALTFGLALVSMIVVLGLVKMGLNISRPPNMQHKIHYSFPSGHTTFATFLTFVVAQRIGSALKPQLRFIPWGMALFISLMVAASRMYLNMHWFADVSGALILGTLFYSVWVYLEDKTYPPKPLKHPVLLTASLVILTAIMILILYPTMLTKYIGM